MSDAFLENEDAIERLLHDDALDDELRPLASAIGDLRTDSVAPPLEPSDRLAAMFDQPEPGSTPARVRGRWLQRPIAAFAVAFVAVLVFGAAALALVNRGSPEPTAATADTSTTSTTSTSAAAQGTAEALLGTEEKSGRDFLTCAFAEVSGFLQRSADGGDMLDRPRIVSECGVPSLPSLGPEAEDYRLALNAWLACASHGFDQLIEQLPGEPGEFEGMFAGCGTPPNPADFGIDLGLEDFVAWFGEDFTFDLENLPLEELGRLPLESLLDGFLDGLPDGLADQIPGEFDIDALLEQLARELPFDLEGLDPARLGDVPIETLIQEFLEGFPDLGDAATGDLDLEGLLHQLGESLPFDQFGLDLESLDLEALRDGLDGLDLVSIFDTLHDEVLGENADGLHGFSPGELELLSEELEAEICGALVDAGLVATCP